MVGDADGGQIQSGQTGFFQGATDDVPSILPDFSRIVLYPSRLWKNLFMLFLVGSDDLTAMVKNDKPVAGCALVQSSHIIGHVSFSIAIKEI